MATDPNQMAQLLQMYRQMFPGGLPQAQAYQNAQAPGQAAMGMGNAPPGATAAAGNTNALAKLLLALMQRKRMQDYNAQYPQQGTTPQGGATPPGGSGMASPAIQDPGG